MTYKTLNSIQEGDAFAITLNRPPLNILNLGMMEELDSALRSAVESKSRFLLLKAEGKAFCAGVDVADHLPEKVEGMLRSFHEIFHLLASFEGLVVACVQGPALGGGCELVLFADFVLASSEARFGQPEIKLGVFPPVALVLLPRICPSRPAAELILSGETIDAAEALRLGIVNRVFEPGRFAQQTGEWLGRFKTLSLSSLRITKRALRKIHPDDFKSKLALAEEEYLKILMSTRDAREGSAAFLEKRKPVWADA